MLSVENLACARGGLPILEGVSFEVKAGEALILRGPNGIGKTTLLRVLAGLQPALEGRVEGAENLAYAGHADGIKAMLSVTENLEFWSDVFGGTGQVDVAVQAFNLGSLADRRAANLSAGQKRRLGLARLLVTGRPFWLLDEPTVSLDVASVALFGDAVRAHLAGGGAAVMATHIDLGLEARVLDVAPYKAKPRAAADAFDEAFL
ncbi:MAG: heme ABC exporter ATP-binding protein CcmA [Pseudomonadota bacterium]